MLYTASWYDSSPSGLSRNAQEGLFRTKDDQVRVGSYIFPVYPSETPYDMLQQSSKPKYTAECKQGVAVSYLEVEEHRHDGRRIGLWGV